MKKSFCFMAVLAVVIAAWSVRVHAAATYWKPFDWQYWTGPNWDPIVPVAGWDAVISHGTAALDFDMTGVAQDILIGTDAAFPTAGLEVAVSQSCLQIQSCSASLTSRHAYIGTLGAGVSGRAFVGTNGGPRIGRAEWTNTGNLIVGYQSTGMNTLELRSNGKVSSGRGIIGYVAGVSGAATVDNSTWNTIGELIVGNGGIGTLDIVNGGDVTTALGWIGYGSNSTGTVTVIGAGSSLASSGNLYIGNQSTSQSHLNIQEGGIVSSSGGRIGWEAGASGRVSVGNGGRWNTGQISVGNLGAGVLNVYNGGIVSANDGVFVFPASSIMGNSTIEGDIYTDGHTRPGAGPPGILHISGDYSQSHLGTLHIDISTSSGYDRLAVNGDLSLAGTLSLELPLFLPWLPSMGDTFNVLDWTGTLSGTFNTLQLPTLPAMRRWNSSQLYTTGVVSIDLLPTGDYSKDGIVDADDYVVWRNTLGRTGINLAADGNGDRKIDAADYDLWRAHFGETFGSGATADVPNGSVPEPASATLILIAGAGLAASRGFMLRRHTTTRADLLLRVFENLALAAFAIELVDACRASLRARHSHWLFPYLPPEPVGPLQPLHHRPGTLTAIPEPSTILLIVLSLVPICGGCNRYGWST